MRDKDTFIYDLQKEVPSPLYYSERGEDCPPRLDDNLFDFLNNGEEYTVWENGSWTGMIFTSSMMIKNPRLFLS